MGRTCWVTIRDADGVEHTVEIGDADHVMQAAASGFVALASEPWSDGARGEIVVEVRTRHTVTYDALELGLGASVVRRRI